MSEPESKIVLPRGHSSNHAQKIDVSKLADGVLLDLHAKPTESEIQAALSEPFPDGVVSCKPQSVKGNRALAVFYIDARDVMDRLDEVVGVAGWKDSYRQLPDGCVACTLAVKIGNEWIAKEDVGSKSDQPDIGDKHKAAYSDALKRAAVKFGVGRFLYELPMQWHDYDPAKKQFVTTPKMPGSSATKPKPQQSATVNDLTKLLKQLAKLRNADETQISTAFLKSFAPPNIVTVSEMPPEMIGRACEAVRKAIKAEQSKQQPTEY